MIGRNEVPTNPTIFVRAAQWLQIVIFAICFYWVQNPFTPYYPQYGLDPSWVAVAGEAAAHSAQWGRDIVLTYGPPSSLITSYYTARLFPTVNMLGGLIIAIVFGAAMNRLIASRSATQCIFSTTLVMLASNLFVFQGLLFLALPMVVFLLCFRVSQGSKSTHLAAVAGAASLGLLALTKFNYAIAALPLLLLADLNSVSRRRLPLLTLAFASSAVLVYFAFGQSLSELPQFLRLNMELVKGYSEAMAFDGHLAELVAILIISALMAALIVRSETTTKLARPTTELLLLFAGLAWYGFLTFKSGFVRQDLHVLITWQMIGFAAILYALSRPWPLYNAATVGILALGIALFGLVAPLRLQMSEPGNTLANLGRFYHTKLAVVPRREASGLLRFVSDPDRWL